MTTQELARMFPEAYKALPECYQADSCLEFEVIDGFLFAYPKEDQVFVLGNWEAMFNRGEWQAIW